MKTPSASPDHSNSNLRPNKVIILGSGTSTGVPIVGCQCAICLSPDPKNKRFRTSIFLHTGQDRRILVDATPDLRSQCLQNNITRIDATIITHDHADHVHGIDDLRPFCFGPPARTIPVVTSTLAAENLTQRFPYIFQSDKIFAGRPIIGGGIPLLDLQKGIGGEGEGPFPYSLLGEPFHFFLLPHGYTQTLGLLHQKFAFLTDCQEIPDPVVETLAAAQLDLLIIDCLKRRPHATHLHLEKTLGYSRRIKAKSTGLIHLSHEFDHEDLSRELQERGEDCIFPVYDGQVLTYSQQAL